MHKEVEKYLSLKREFIVLEYACVFGSNLEVYKACGIPKSTFYDWKKAFEEEGEKGLAYKKPMARIHPGSLSSKGWFFLN